MAPTIVMMKHLDLESLGKLIKAARKRKNLTQADVANGIKDISGIEITQSTISEWESGARNPGFLGVYYLCRMLEMTVDELLGVKEAPALSIKVTEQEQDDILSMFEECEQELEFSNLQKKLRFLKHYVTALFSRAHSK